MTKSLQGKRVLVVGATGYIGQALTIGIAQAGAEVLMHYHSNGAAVESLCAQVHKVAGYQPRAFQCDVSDPEAAETLVTSAWRAAGRIDVLIHCVGHAVDNSIVFLKPEDVASTLKSNLNTVVNVCEPLSRLMCEHGGGSIVNISSITGLVGQPMRSLYGAGKAAVISYSKALARAVADRHVRVNCLAPQVVEGGLADNMKGMVKALMEENTPIKAQCQAEDLIEPMLMLASDGSPFITGEVINITGGLVTW